MPVPVLAVLWEPTLSEMPLNAENWMMFELPAPATHYWHGRIGYRVDRIEEVDGETRVHLVRDPDWEEEMSAGLPDNYLVDGGRREDDGSWHFRVAGPSGPLAGGWAFGEDCETAIHRAVAGAVAQLNRERGTS